MPKGLILSLTSYALSCLLQSGQDEQPGNSLSREVLCCRSLSNQGLADDMVFLLAFAAVVRAASGSTAPLDKFFRLPSHILHITQLSNYKDFLNAFPQVKRNKGDRTCSHVYIYTHVCVHVGICIFHDVFALAPCTYERAQHAFMHDMSVRMYSCMLNMSILMYS